VQGSLASDVRSEADVLHAVLSSRLHALRSGERNSDLGNLRVRHVCLAVDPGGAPQSPDKEFMARFSAQPDVLPLAYCEVRDGAAVEARSGARAVILTAGPVEWIARDEAWVTFTFFRDRRHELTNVYRVVRQQQRWISLGPILKMSLPA
jgi:hypothetical protein